MKDRLRELLFPLTVLAIVASMYALAAAHSGEAEVERHFQPQRHADAAFMPTNSPEVLASERASLLD